MFRRARSLFRALTARRDFEKQMTDELRFHIEQCAEDFMRVPACRVTKPTVARAWNWAA